MNIQEVIDHFTNKYPDKAIVKNPNDNPTEVICEIGPTSDHPEYSVAIAAIKMSKEHFHLVTQETYEILKGILKLNVDGKEIVLKTGDIYTILPNTSHFATGNFTIAKVTSRPGWTAKDHKFRN
jgi:mannose-6-phosphate isomerase-like protein (cupin superfamily)